MHMTTRKWVFGLFVALCALLGGGATAHATVTVEVVEEFLTCGTRSVQFMATSDTPISFGDCTIDVVFDPDQGGPSFSASSYGPIAPTGCFAVPVFDTVNGIAQLKYSGCGPTLSLGTVPVSIGSMNGPAYELTTNFFTIVGCSVEDSFGVAQTVVIGAGWSEDLDLCFDRGDANNDGVMDLADAVTVLGNGPYDCDDAADANDSGGVDIADAVYLFGAVFGTGPMPPAPFGACGFDRTADGLDCGAFGGCP